jgi:ABC-type branched-subunit amino acid transport system substrate-binding protein
MNRTLLAACMAASLAGVPVAHAEIKSDVIRIGVLTDMSGPFATAMGPGSVTAARMAAAAFGDTIKGHRIEILQADNLNKPDVASAIARQWFDRDGVLAIADGGSSAAALAVQDLVRSNNRIFLVSGAAVADLSDRSCAPTAVQWTQDTKSTANAVVVGVHDRVKGPWFFITADYTFGHAMESDARAKLAALGEKVAGSASVPMNTTDYSSFLLEAQASGAKVVALNVAGGNATAMKQAAEFGLAAQGMAVAPMSFQNVDIKAVGLPVAQGDLIATSFFEDESPAARAWSDRFFAIRNAMPSQIQAGVYSAVRHYLQAVSDSNSDDGPTVMAKMRETEVNDAYASHGRIRPDGRMAQALRLVQVKTPAESKGPWDLVTQVGMISAADAFRPLNESHCPGVEAP